MRKIKYLWRRFEDAGMPDTDLISILAIIISLIAILVPYLLKH